jgi:hypothetical protein
MKTLIFIPLSLAVMAALMAVVCRIARLDVGNREALFAVIIAAFAAEIAFLPAWLAQKSESVRFAQAALGGTLLHLFITFVLGAALLLAKFVLPQPFVYWLLGAYWISLSVLVVALLKLSPMRPPTESTAK